ncbi:ATP-binding cassette, subfamily C, CydD [Marinospirillum celere]|uniref:ATP-binding cassette, subfamily C, CydD n=1 Tax=Marinospirillum celere TaxID=1122252 RepID=A0A1I1FVS7_9GAMM|nr:thiol reductant ABC exporter subunit CydD [Marinospirillum celere]SFC01738.1 ATP-binding cassette, subfamily C, CydD [Marinospirillum celere]
MKAITELDRKKRNRNWLRQLAAQEKSGLLMARLLGLLLTLVILLQLGLMAWLISQLLVEKQPLESLLGYWLLLIALIVIRSLLQSLQEGVGQAVGNRLRLRVREQLLSHLARLGPIGLSGDSPASLSSQWLEQVDALQIYFARFVPQMTLAWASPLIFLGAVFYLDWVAGLFLLVSAPLIPLFMALVGWGAERLNQQHFVLLKRLSGHFLDRIRGLTSLKLFGQTQAACDQVVAATEDYRRLNMRTLKVAFLSSAVLEFFASVAIAAVAIYIGFGLLGYIAWGPAPSLTLFSGLLILLLAPEFFQPLRTLAQQYHDRAAALGAADSLVDLLERPVSESPSANKTSEARLSPWMLDLDHVCISFAERGQVLGPISLQLGRGSCLLISGRTGSGKSSLLHLLAGFIQPTSGSLHVEGLPAGERPLVWMQQQAFIFQGTWAENLRLAAPQANSAQMLDALQQVGLLELLGEQAEGLDTPLLEGGRSLSGGQAQRLVLARALLTPSRLLLLDEPSASLDDQAADELLNLLFGLKMQGCTLVIASHDDRFLKLADHHLELTSGGQDAST